jgi:Zn-finger nucleic acid-binding protein
MHCLNCRAEMTTYDVVTKKDRLTYNACDKCGSLWLDAGTLDKMAFKVAGSIEYCEDGEHAEPEAHAKPCPRCEDSALTRVKFLGCDDITLHHCKNCGGFWLNGGELNLVDGELAKIMPVGGHGFSDFVNDVHVPYWFKRTARKSSDTDFVVASPPIHGAELKTRQTGICPACSNALNTYRVFSLDFQGCPKCKGVWLVEDELRKLKNKEGEGSLRWLNDEIENLENTHIVTGTRHCVQCPTTKMATVIFGHSSIAIDWCPNCHGIWLDRGEFDAIVDYLKDELDAMPPKDIGSHLATDLARAVTGGPESRLAELRDAQAAWSALVNAKIFQNPALFNLLTYSGLPR